ncbi:MAG: hypothetical protein HQK83_03125 [Fibrobacteria bacterium]|nr:hypothetical protein [Fibrobacteria bacterium]
MRAIFLTLFAINCFGNPCQDTTYTELKSVSRINLSSDQFKALFVLEKACYSYNDSLMNENLKLNLDGEESCNDSLFLSLKRKKLNTMNENEKRLYARRNNICEKYKRNNSPLMTTYLIVSIISGFTLILVLLTKL